MLLFVLKMEIQIFLVLILSLFQSITSAYSFNLRTSRLKYIAIHRFTQVQYRTSPASILLKRKGRGESNSICGLTRNLVSLGGVCRSYARLHHTHASVMQYYELASRII
jgi:hypothetical protein